MVVSETMKMIMDDDAIEAIVSMLMELQEQDNTNIPLYERQLQETNTKIRNLINAIQQGVLTKSTKESLEELEAAKEELETRLANEQLSKPPKISAEFMTFWLHRFRKLDVTKQSHRKMLIDTFINAIYLYDDTIGYVIVEYSLSSFVERVAPDDACVCVYYNSNLVFSGSNAQASVHLPGNMQNSDQFQLEGHTYTVSRQNPRLDGLEVLVGIPTDQLSNIRATLLTVIALVTLLVLCSFAVLGFWLNRQLFTPVEQLIASSYPHNGDTSEVIHSIAADLSEIKITNDSLQRERDSILPLALGRQLDRLLQASDASVSAGQRRAYSAYPAPNLCTGSVGFNWY